MAHDRKDLLRKWLRSRGIHPADIAVSLEWYEQERAVGRNPADAQVLERAEKCHADAVGQFRKVEPGNIVVRYELSWKIVGFAALASFVGSALWDLVQTLLR